MDFYLQEFSQKLKSAFVPERAIGIDAVILLKLVGEQNAEWYMTIKGQQVDLHIGSFENPNLTITMDYQDALDLYQGNLDPTRAFMLGKIRLSGDTGLAMRLLGMFRTS